MTEHEWLQCTRPDPMLSYLVEQQTISDRKVVLYCCACCRSVWHLLHDEFRRILRAVESYADQGITAQDLVTLRSNFSPHRVPLVNLAGGSQAAAAVHHLIEMWRFDPYGSASWEYRTYSVGRSAAEAHAKTIAWSTARQNQCGFVMDLFGNPFQPAPPLPLGVLAWNDNTVGKLAQHIYEQHDFDSLPILADALEDIGFTNEDIIEHLRGPGPHFRGCWVLDLVRSVD